MEIDEITAKIKNNLIKNGFPEKKVSFPKASVENFVKKYDYELLNVLIEMQQQDIFYKITDEKIYFSNKDFETEEEVPDNKDEFDMSKIDMSALKNMDPKVLREQAEQMMKNMSPEQLAEIKEKFEKMPLKEKMKIMEMAKNMGM